MLAASSDPAQLRMSDRRTRKSTVLVTDDSANTRRILALMLERAGFHVEQAESGERTLEMARSRVFNAFLLDLRMPGMGGIEVCRRLRAQHTYRMTPILIVTAVEEKDKLTEAFEAGCDDYIAKPANPVVLEARLRGHLQKLQYLNQLERLRLNLNRYVSPRTLEMVEAFTLGGTLPPPAERLMCILFSDIRGFTALSQAMEPGILFDMVSHQLGAQVRLVYQHGGYIDKFGGDGLMAVFDRDDMARAACRCALAIMDESMRQADETTAHVLRPSIGVHLGNALIGNIGSNEHLDYSVIGESVNLAARLCGLAEPMTILVSRAVRDAVLNDPHLRFQEEREELVRGFREVVRIFTLRPEP
jgi:adenylate cyclase